MNVNDYIHLYTTVMGWQFYGVLWKLIAGSGLVYIPVLFLVFEGLTAARASGSIAHNDADSALSTVEVDLLKFVIVFFLAAVPTGLTSIDSSSVSFKGATTASTDSTFDDSFAKSSILTQASVPIPAYWYGVMAISQGITGAFVKAAGTTDNYRDLDVALTLASIKNAHTRYLLQVFNNECHIPARSKYYRDTTRGANTGDDDVYWPGSLTLQNTAAYYPALRTRTFIKGYAFDATKDVEFSEDPKLGGRPDCKTLWTDISADIFEEAKADGVVGFLAKFGLVTTRRKAAIVNRYIQTERVEPLASADELNSIRMHDSFRLSRIFQFVGDTATSVGMALGVLLIRSGLNATIYAVTFVQAYVLMTIYLFLPIGMLASKFSTRFLADGALLIFTVTFWTALWAIAAQADSFMTTLLWGDNLAEKIGNYTGPESVLKDLVHSVVVLALYFLLPAVTTWVILAAGVNVQSAIGGLKAGAKGVDGAAKKGFKFIVGPEEGPPKK